MKIMWQDVLVAFGFILLLGSGVATKYIITSLSTLNDAAKYIETNPITRQIVNIGYFINILQMIAVAFLSGIYYLLRRRYNMSPLPENLQILDFYTITIFILFLQIFMNDFPIALSVFMGK